MIYNFRYAESFAERNDVLEYLKEKKFDKVLDIGFSINTWSSPYTTHYMDINKNDSDKHPFIGNICEYDIWSEVLEYVDKNGKFDFAICTHVLEDITSPGMVCKLLPKVAKEGYIAVPSKYAELSKIENACGRYNGWIHHRWIFNKEGNDFVGYPKVVCTEYKDYSRFHDRGNKIQDLRFFWKDDFEFKIVNNDFLGPNCYAVCKLFDGLYIDDQ